MSGISSSSQKEQLETLLAVQPDDMTGKHQDGDHNPLERPQVSEKADRVVAESTSHADQGEKFVFQVEVGMDLETAQVAARHFVILPIDRQQRKTTTTRSIDRGGDHPIQADVGGNPKTTTVRGATREEAAIGWQQRGTTPTEQNKLFDPGA